MKTITSQERLELEFAVLTLEGAINGLLKIGATHHDRALDDVVFNAYRALDDIYCDLAGYIDSRRDLRVPRTSDPQPSGV